MPSSHFLRLDAIDFRSHSCHHSSPSHERKHLTLHVSKIICRPRSSQVTLDGRVTAAPGNYRRLAVTAIQEVAKVPVTGVFHVVTAEYSPCSLLLMRTSNKALPPSSTTPFMMLLLQYETLHHARLSTQMTFCPGTLSLQPMLPR